MRLMIFNTIYKFDINLTNNLLIMVEGLTYTVLYSYFGTT